MNVGDDLATTLRVIEGAAHFMVTTQDPICQERIVHMGWQPEGDNVYVRKLSASIDITRIHENFRRHLKEMVLQSARLRPVPWDAALEEFLARVEGTSLYWWLYGSAALAVRGLDIAPRDLDFAVDDAHHAGRIFNDLLVEPVTGPLDWVAQWIGRAFHGALFEWSAQAARRRVGTERVWPLGRRPPADDHVARAPGARSTTRGSARRCPSPGPHRSSGDDPSADAA
jgi:hypothetical protein